MFFYLALLVVTALIINVEGSRQSNVKCTRLILDIFSITFVIIIGFRHEVGGDWNSYLEQLSWMDGAPLSAILTSNPGYALLNWLGSNLWGGIYTVNLISSTLLIYGLRTFCLQQPLPLVSFLVAIPYLLLIVGSGYTRQSIAIGMFLMAISALYKNQILKYVAWILVASLFHKTAMLLLFFGIFSMVKNWFSVSLSILIFNLIFFEEILFYINQYSENYLVNSVKSAGVVYRLCITLFAAFIFILNYHRLLLSKHVKQFWLTMIAGFILLSVLLLFFPENTTAIDRIGLYWLPLQIMIFAQLPYIYKFKIVNYSVMLLGVSLYSVMLLVIWFYFSEHAYQWIPYQFYPWVWWWL